MPEPTDILRNVTALQAQCLGAAFRVATTAQHGDRKQFNVACELFHRAWKRLDLEHQAELLQFMAIELTKLLDSTEG